MSENQGPRDQQQGDRGERQPSKKKVAPPIPPEMKRSFNLRHGIRNYVIFSLAWCMIVTLSLLTGFYDWAVTNDSGFDYTIKVLSLTFPATCIAFIKILEN